MIEEILAGNLGADMERLMGEGDGMGGGHGLPSAWASDSSDDDDDDDDDDDEEDEDDDEDESGEAGEPLLGAVEEVSSEEGGDGYVALS